MKKSIFSFISIFLFCGSVFAQQRNEAFALKGVKWQQNVIPVSWENPSPENEQERQWVQEAISGSWSSASSVVFTGWGQANQNSKGIRILIEDAAAGPHTKGLGNELDSKKDGMVLNFTFNNWSPKMKNKRKEYIVAVAVHEFGHALGLAHEHNRKDCAFCDLNPQGSDGDYYVTTCDPNSVMNYCNPSYANWGRLSDGDKKAIGTIYDKQVSNSAPSVNDNDITIEYTLRDLTDEEEQQHPYDKKVFKVFLDASAAELNLISNVTYYLPPSFSEQVMVVDNMESNFGLGLFIDAPLEIGIKINYHDGSFIEVKDQLDFDDPFYEEGE